MEVLGLLQILEYFEFNTPNLSETVYRILITDPSTTMNSLGVAYVSTAWALEIRMSGVQIQLFAKACGSLPLWLRTRWRLANTFGCATISWSQSFPICSKRSLYYYDDTKDILNLTLGIPKRYHCRSPRQSDVSILTTLVLWHCVTSNWMAKYLLPIRSGSWQHSFVVFLLRQIETVKHQSDKLTLPCNA